jgi:phasin family protein
MDDQFSDQANRAADAATKAADASRRTINEGGKVASQMAEHAARAQEQIAHRAADAGMRGAGIVKATIEKSIEATVHGFERVTDQFTSAMGFGGVEAEKLATRSRENLEAISQANSAIIKGAEDMSHQWMSFAKDAFAKNFDAMIRLKDSRSIQDLAAMQSDLWRENMTHAIEGGRQLAQIYAKTAEEAADRVRNNTHA